MIILVTLLLVLAGIPIAVSGATGPPIAAASGTGVAPFDESAGSTPADAAALAAAGAQSLPAAACASCQEREEAAAIAQAELERVLDGRTLEQVSAWRDLSARAVAAAAAKVEQAAVKRAGAVAAFDRAYEELNNSRAARDAADEAMSRATKNWQDAVAGATMFCGINVAEQRGAFEVLGAVLVHLYGVRLSSSEIGEIVRTGAKWIAKTIGVVTLGNCLSDTGNYLLRSYQWAMASSAQGDAQQRWLEANGSPNLSRSIVEAAAAEHQRAQDDLAVEQRINAAVEADYQTVLLASLAATAARQAAQQCSCSEPVDLRCVEPLRCGGTYGDPHLRTFDGVQYDFQGAGDYDLVSSTTDAFRIDVRYTRDSSNKAISFNRALVVSLPNSDRIRFGDDGLQAPGQAMSVELPSGEHPSPNVGSIITLNDGSKLGFDGVWWALRTGDGIIVRVQNRAGRGLVVGVPPARAGQLRGLLGNSDGNPDNDLRGESGETISPYDWSQVHGSLLRAMLRPFSINLFRNSASSADVYPTVPFRSLESSDLTESQRAWAEGICRNAGIASEPALRNCVLDVGATSDDTLAYGTLAFTNAVSRSARPKVLIFGHTEENVEQGVLRDLLAPGYQVDVSESLPEDLSPFKAIVHLDVRNPLTSAEQDRLRQFVRNGGGLMLTGERPCCEETNSAVSSLAYSIIKGNITVGGQPEPCRCTIDAAVRLDAPGGIATTPNRLTTWHMLAPGGIANIDSRNILATGQGDQIVAAAFESTDIIGNRGRLVVAMDVNWLGSNRGETATAIVQNVAQYLTHAP